LISVQNGGCIINGNQLESEILNVNIYFGLGLKYVGGIDKD